MIAANRNTGGQEHGKERQEKEEQEIMIKH